MFPIRTSTLCTTSAHKSTRSPGFGNLLFEYNFVRRQVRSIFTYFTYFSICTHQEAFSKRISRKHTALLYYARWAGWALYSCLRVFTHNTRWVTHNNSILIHYALYIIHILYCYNIVIDVEIIIEQWQWWWHCIIFYYVRVCHCVNFGLGAVRLNII